MLVKFATQVEKTTLTKLKALAKKENKHLQHFVNEALENLLLEYNENTLREEVLTSSRVIRNQFRNTFKELAK
ncbi:hypothetical protein HPDP_00637 [Candidatus Hepatincola sp. Pdp]